jgi:cytoskeletal protein CcmA (bactofilin family)
MATFGRGEGEGTTIGTHVKLTGVLSDPNDIVILGKLEGEVHSDHTVTVGPQAQVKGPITAARVVIAGTVRGNMHTRDRLEILPRGNVNGNIETRDLVIHSGATFNGRSQITGGEAQTKELETGEGAQSAPTQPPAGPPTPSLPAAPRRMWPPLRLANLGSRRQRPERGDGEKATPSDKPKESADDSGETKPTYEVE